VDGIIPSPAKCTNKGEPQENASWNCHERWNISQPSDDLRLIVQMAQGRGESTYPCEFFHILVTTHIVRITPVFITEWLVRICQMEFLAAKLGRRVEWSCALSGRSGKMWIRVKIIDLICTWNWEVENVRRESKSKLSFRWGPDPDLLDHWLLFPSFHRQRSNDWTPLQLSSFTHDFFVGIYERSIRSDVCLEALWHQVHTVLESERSLQILYLFSGN